MNFKVWFENNSNIWYRGSNAINPFDPNSISKQANGQTIYGWYFSQNFLYAMSYSTDHTVYPVQIISNKISRISFNTGMTIDQRQT